MRSLLSILTLLGVAAQAGLAQQRPWSEQLPVGQGGPAAQDPGVAPPDVAGPGVARMSMLESDVSVRRGDANEAVAAALNAPLMAGDAIATGPSARAEIQFDSASRVRLGSEVDIRVADLEPGRFRLELAHGTASLSVLRDTRSQAEISTPIVSMRPTQRGLYRVAVGDDGVVTITARYGEAEIYSRRGTEKLAQGQTMMVRGSADDPEFQIIAAPQEDDWDRWNEQRDQALAKASSYNYMSPAIPGGEDLDANGSWVYDPAYGEVWTPRVDPGWAPYREGRWVWEDYYGWTWVSSDPWGWAPYHYGNWYYGAAGWCWYPGVYARPPFWRPALVAFFGFGGFGVGFGFGGWGNIGWLPLAPFEAFHPWYGRGIGRGAYAFDSARLARVNVANLYRNARVNGAISGVSAGAFTSGRFSSIGRVNAEQVRNAGLARGALPVSPSASNMRFNDRTTSVAPRSFANTHFQGGSAISNRAISSRPSTVRTTAGANTAAGWGRFGNGASTTAGRSAPPSAYRGGATAQSSSSWGRFGNPGGTPARTTYSNATRSAPSGGYPHFESSPANAARTGANGFGQPRSYWQGNSQALRISPSIVHSRTYDQGSGATRSYSAPARSSEARPSGGGSSAGTRSSGGGVHSSSNGGGSHSGHR